MRMPRMIAGVFNLFSWILFIVGVRFCGKNIGKLRQSYNMRGVR